MEKDYSSDRTITNIANKSVHGMDDVTRRNQAVEMYQRRRGFFRGVGYFHKFRHSHLSNTLNIHTTAISTYSLTNSHSTLNFIGRRENQRGTSRKGEQRGVQTKKRVLSKE